MAERTPGDDEAGADGEPARPDKRRARARRRNLAALGVIAVVAFGAYFFWLRPLLEMVTYEPVDQMNEIADWLIATESERELEQLARDIRARATELDVPFGRTNHPALVAMVPEKLWRFEGQQGKHPELTRWLMLLPASVHIHKPLFANGSHDIMIFDEAPASPPTGFFGRIVGERVYVVSYHCQRCSTKPAGHSREVARGDARTESN